MKVKPLRDWMILDPDETKDNESTIAVPEAYEENFALDKAEAATFTVKDMGPGWWEGGEFHEMPITIGDRVVLEGRSSIALLKIDGENVYMAQARWVALIIDKDNAQT